MKSQPTAAQSVVDVDIVLERLNGNRDMLGVLATYFLEDAPQILEQLRDAARTNSIPQIVRFSHSLKGLAATFEPTPVMLLASEIEMYGRAGDSSQIPQLIPQLDLEFVKLVETLQAMNAPPG
jgi:HPt (histidine-containing phosphotransfer) domain-containing protein